VSEKNIQTRIGDWGWRSRPFGFATAIPKVARISVSTLIYTPAKICWGLSRTKSSDDLQNITRVTVFLFLFQSWFSNYFRFWQPYWFL